MVRSLLGKSASKVAVILQNTAFLIGKKIL